MKLPSVTSSSFWEKFARFQYNCLIVTKVNQLFHFFSRTVLEACEFSWSSYLLEMNILFREVVFSEEPDICL